MATIRRRPRSRWTASGRHRCARSWRRVPCTAIQGNNLNNIIYAAEYFHVNLYPRTMVSVTLDFSAATLTGISKRCRVARSQMLTALTDAALLPR